MKAKRAAINAAVAFLTAAVTLAAPARAADIKVMCSGGLAQAYRGLVPAFERASGHTLSTAWGSSMGGAPDSIPSRLERGEPADVVIMAGSSIDELIAQGEVRRGSRVDLARSSIGMAVRAGAPKPDIGSVEALKATLLRARSIAYSASASGTYLATELFPRLGIADRIRGKAKRIESERVGTVVARGDAEIGFQQISELLPIAGIDYVGPLPPEAQKVTVYSAGVAVDAGEPEAARALIAFLTSPAAAPAFEASGVEPATRD